ncbi:nucleotide-diphospho-sugar transferase [Hysterangium stoloniferum]|nr:nucleotide-diphospho-sugar transferase [Hysterangium stoloniferum]
MKRTFATLLTRDSYLAGTLILNQSLVATKSKYDLVVMVTPGLSTEARGVLCRQNIKVKEIERLHPKPNSHFLSSHDERFAETWTKLKVFELVEYDRVVLLDSDMIILRNIDDLLDQELPGPDWIAACHACTCNPRKLAHYPEDWIPENCAYTPLKVTNNNIVPKPTEMTSKSPRTHRLLNSGTVLLQPSEELAKEIYHYLETSPLVPTFSFPDQDLLANFFAGRWKPLPYIYNALKTLRVIHPELWRDEHVGCVHYILPDKPWKTPRGTAGDFEIMNGWWWDFYDELHGKLKASDSVGYELVASHVTSAAI